MRQLRTLLVFTTLIAPAAHAAPVLLELFTSQSCSSCPPADELLAQLARRTDVIALDLHVDYWDNLGWRDPYSAAQFTARQRAYATNRGDAEIYTPQLVINGTQSVVGSDRAAVDAAIASAESLPIALHITAHGPTLTITADAQTGDATLYLAGVATSTTTRIGGGENGGRTLTEANIVLALHSIAGWSGTTRAITQSRPQGDHVIAFLQAPNGRILGAAEL